MDVQEAKKKQQEEMKKVAHAIEEVARTEAGKIFFHWLMKVCFFHNSTITADPRGHEINAMGTIFNESRRRVYLDIRRHISPGLLRKIENK